MIAVPGSVKAAIGCQIAGVALALVTYFAVPVAGRGLPVTVVGAFVGIAVAFFILRAVYQGVGWVRMLLTVLAALGTLLVPLDLITGLIEYTWLDLVGIGLTDAAVVLLWLSPSRHYFAAARQARLLPANDEPEGPAPRV